LKIDGFRSLAYIENGHCELVSRNGNTFRNVKDLANGSEKTCFWQRFYRCEIVCIDAVDISLHGNDEKATPDEIGCSCAWFASSAV